MRVIGLIVSLDLETTVLAASDKMLDSTIMN